MGFYCISTIFSTVPHFHYLLHLPIYAKSRRQGTSGLDEVARQAGLESFMATAAQLVGAAVGAPLVAGRHLGQGPGDAAAAAVIRDVLQSGWPGLVTKAGGRQKAAAEELLAAAAAPLAAWRLPGGGRPGVSVEEVVAAVLLHARQPRRELERLLRLRP